MLDPRLVEIINDVLGTDVDLEESTTAADLEGWDSLAHINIMVAVEEEFHVSFTTDQLSRFRNVGELQQFLQEWAQ